MVVGHVEGYIIRARMWEEGLGIFGGGIPAKVLAFEM